VPDQKDIILLVFDQKNNGAFRHKIYPIVTEP